MLAQTEPLQRRCPTNLRDVVCPVPRMDGIYIHIEFQVFIESCQQTLKIEKGTTLQFTNKLHF